MALTASAAWDVAPGNHLVSLPIQAAEVIYDGALVDVAAGGGLINHDDSVTATTNFFMGVAQVTDQTGISAAAGESKTGNTALSVFCAVDISGIILQGAAVTSSSDANVGNLVYATDENTLTMSATAGGQAVGWLVRSESATVGDVKLFTPGEARAQHGV